MVGVASVLTADGERLAGRPAEDYLDPALVLTELVPAHIFFDNVPIPNVLHLLYFVATERTARIPIPIEHRDVLKARSGRTQR
jgi:hypothetical protein